MSAIEIIGAALIKYGPGIARALVDIFTKDVVIKEDWDKLFLQIESKSYDDYVKPNVLMPPT